MCRLVRTEVVTYAADWGPNAGLIGLPIDDCTLPARTGHHDSWWMRQSWDVSVV